VEFWLPAVGAADDGISLLTGDLATRSDDGYFRLVGRRGSDLIKTAGFKVGAGEVEAALLEHEAVVEAAAPGVPDREYGERIVAWVVVRSGSHVTAETLPTTPPRVWSATSVRGRSRS
jgi:malonyl-CoA/methylmalonyl-CoA synthetase